MMKPMGIAALILVIAGCAAPQQNRTYGANHSALMVAIMQASDAPASSSQTAQTKSPKDYTRRELKAFILSNSTPIRSQLENTTKGAEVDTLLKGLELPDNEHDTHIPVLQRIAHRHSNDSDFAEEVLDYYSKQ